MIALGMAGGHQKDRLPALGWVEYVLYHHGRYSGPSSHGTNAASRTFGSSPARGGLSNVDLATPFLLLVRLTLRPNTDALPPTR